MKENNKSIITGFLESLSKKTADAFDAFESKESITIPGVSFFNRKVIGLFPESIQKKFRRDSKTARIVGNSVMICETVLFICVLQAIFSFISFFSASTAVFIYEKHLNRTDGSFLRIILSLFQVCACLIIDIYPFRLIYLFGDSLLKKQGSRIVLLIGIVTFAISLICVPPFVNSVFRDFISIGLDSGKFDTFFYFYLPTLIFHAYLIFEIFSWKKERDSSFFEKCIMLFFIGTLVSFSIAVVYTVVFPYTFPLFHLFILERFKYFIVYPTPTMITA